MKKEETDLLEKLATLEHQQWMSWAKNLIKTEKISAQTITRWETYFVPYHQLPDEIKELDRVYGRKVISIIEEVSKLPRCKHTRH